MAKNTQNPVTLISIDNDNTGVNFVFQEDDDKTPIRFSVDEGDEKGSLNVLPDFEGEISVVFPEGAWVTVERGRVVVKFANYGNRESFDVLPYDYTE